MNKFFKLFSGLLCLPLIGGIMMNSTARDVVRADAATGTATVKFGSAKSDPKNVQIKSTSVSFTDNLGGLWTCTTKGTTSFTESSAYYQIGSKSSAATSIELKGTLSSNYNITSVSSKWGGNNGTAGTISMKVGDSVVGTGSLSGGNDVQVQSTKAVEGNKITISVSGIAKSVKLYNISYTCAETGTSVSSITLPTVNSMSSANSLTVSPVVINVSEAVSWSVSPTNGITTTTDGNDITFSVNSSVALGTIYTVKASAGSITSNEMKIVVSSHTGTSDDPYEADEVVGLFKSGFLSSDQANKYVTGFLVLVSELESKYYLATENDIGSRDFADLLQLYNLKMDPSLNVNIDVLQQGYKIKVFGTLKYYKNTQPEVDYSTVKEILTKDFSVTDVTIEIEDTIDGGNKESATADVLYDVAYDGLAGLETISIKITDIGGNKKDFATSVPASGLFTIDFTENGTFIVTITSTEDPSKSASGTITVTNIAEVATPQYVLTDSIADGDYIIASSEYKYVMGDTVSSSRISNGTTPTVSDNVIKTRDLSIVWKITKDGDSYTIQNKGNNKYLAATSTKNEADLVGSVNNYARWNISYDTDSFVFENVARKSATSDSNNRFLRNNAAIGWAAYSSGTGSAPRLFAYVDEGRTLTDFAITKQGVTSYKEGLALTASGFEFTATYSTSPTSYVFQNITSDNLQGLTFEPALGTKLSTIGTTSVKVSYTFGEVTKSVSFNVTVNEAAIGTYEKVTSELVDYRGTYIAVYENDGGTSKVLNGSLDTIDAVNNGIDATITDNKIVGNRAISLSELKVERNLISGTSYYNVNIGNNKYLHGSGNANISAENEASAKNSASFELVNKSLTLKINNFVLKFNNASDQMRFRFYFDTSTMKNVALYKLVTTDSINNEVNNYASTFSTKINAICDINGVNTNVDKLNTAWGELASSFKGLSVDAQGIIASVSYTRNGGANGSKEYVADKYDYIFSKYSDKLTDGDFMTRQGLSVYQPSAVRSSFFELNMNSASSISMIVLIAIISISSIGGYLVIKRRKEN